MPVRNVCGSTVTYLSGGTRTGVKLSRPWQPAIGDIINQSGCPFCNRLQTEVSCANPKWRTIRNTNTPHRWHFLIIPKVCSDASSLMSLGGQEGVEDVFQIVQDLIVAHDLHEEVALFVHVGVFAGQNLGHLHWHLTPAVTSEEFRPEMDSYDSSQVISRGDNISVAADGLRAGQVIFALGQQTTFSIVATELAATITSTIERGQEVLRSTQGHQPHFNLTVRIGADGQVHFATYIPIVNFWGGSDLVGMLEGGPVALPWTHGETAELFQGDKL
jgi:diadenosine tetraphosphate (Ap4A) HIT family hydrolase